MAKHHHNHVQLLRLIRWKDHHVFFLSVLCILVVILTATIVRVVKMNISASEQNVAIGEDQSHQDERPEKKQKKKKKPAEVEVIPKELTTVPRRLDGVSVLYPQSNPLPLCVMIENLGYEGVRPQFGLSQAAVVYEAIVEGGITRFMAVFQGHESTTVGPVRSARDTYLEFASEYNCPYFHAGGSYTAIQALRNLRMRYVDGLIEGKYFWRDNRRYAPHNLFSSIENLRLAVTNHNWYNEAAPSFEPWTFASTSTLSADDVAATTIRIPFGNVYDVEYRYDAEKKVYVRWNGGVKQTDAANGVDIAPRTVIIQHVGAGMYVEGKGRINWPVTGEGEVEIFDQGRVRKGKWIKQTRLARTRFVDEEGVAIPLESGNFWIEIVPEHINSTYY